MAEPLILLNQDRAHNIIRLHWKYSKHGRHINLLILSGHPERFPEYTSLLACAQGPTFLASSYQTNPPGFILVEVVNFIYKTTLIR
jgi:hypothetical protein